MENENVRPAAGRGSKEKSIRDQVNKLNVVYHWDRLPLSDKSPASPATNDILRSVNQESVTKRSSRRRHRRHRRHGGDARFFFEDKGSNFSLWTPWDIGSEGRDISITKGYGGCETPPPPRDSVEDPGKPKQLAEENEWGAVDDSGGQSRIYPGASALSLGDCFRAQESCSRAVGGSDGGFGETEPRWHSRKSLANSPAVDERASIAVKNRQENKSVDKNGEASDDSSQRENFDSSRGWAQGLRASELRARRRQIVSDDPEGDRGATRGSEEPFDFCERFREKATLRSFNCSAEKKADTSPRSRKENAPLGDWSGDEHTAGLFSDAHERTRSAGVGRAGDFSFSSPTKPGEPSDSSPGEHVLIRKPRNRRRFVILGDSEGEDPTAGGIESETARPVDVATAAVEEIRAEGRQEPNDDGGKTFSIKPNVPKHSANSPAAATVEIPVEGNIARRSRESGCEGAKPGIGSAQECFVRSQGSRRSDPQTEGDDCSTVAGGVVARLVVETTSSRTRHGGDERGARYGESPATRSDFGAGCSSSSNKNGDVRDDEDDGGCAVVFRRTTGKPRGRRRFVVETSDSSVEERDEKLGPVDLTEVLDVVSARQPPSRAEGATEEAKSPAAGSEAHDSFDSINCWESADDGPAGDVQKKGGVSEKFVASSRGRDAEGDSSFVLPKADGLSTNRVLRKPPFPRPRLRQRGGPRCPRRRNIIKSDSSEENDSACARRSCSPNESKPVAVPRASGARISVGQRASSQRRRCGDPADADDRRLTMELTSPSAKRPQSRGRRERVIEASTSSEATPVVPVHKSAGEGSVDSTDEEIYDGNTIRSPSRSSKIPATRGRLPPQTKTRKNTTVESVKDGINPSRVASESDGDTSPRDRSPARRPRGRGREGGRKNCTRAQVSAGDVVEGLSGSAFSKSRDSLTAEYFAEFNDGAFGGALSDVKVTWNIRLSRTAGVTKTFRRTAPFGGFEYVASIELSSKVLDTEPKLRETLLHELCHAAAWVIDHNSKPPHGEHFWAWARRAKAAHPGVPITTCHSYEINFKYRYVCVGRSSTGGEGEAEHERRGCGAEIGRHSKSIDVAKQVCGRCKGRLMLFGTHGKNGKLKKPRAASGFSLFVKEHYAEVKAEMPTGTPQQRVMKEISKRWAARAQDGRPRDDPDNIVDGLKALSLQPSFLPSTTNASKMMTPDGGKKVGRRARDPGVGEDSGGQENTPSGVIDVA